MQLAEVIDVVGNGRINYLEFLRAFQGQSRHTRTRNDGMSMAFIMCCPCVCVCVCAWPAVVDHSKQAAHQAGDEVPHHTTPDTGTKRDLACNDRIH